MVYAVGNVPPNFNASNDGKSRSFSKTFLIDSINGYAPNTSNDGNAPNSNGSAPLHPIQVSSVVLQKRNSKKWKKKRVKLEKKVQVIYS